MIPARIEGATIMYGAPEGWDEARGGLCGVLPVRQEPPYLLSAWPPLPEELAALNAGGSVLLHIVGSAHPVVALCVSNPPEPV